MLQHMHNHVTDTAQLGGSLALDLRLRCRRYSFISRPCLNVSDLVICTKVSNAGLWNAE